MSLARHEQNPAAPLPPEACLEIFEKLSEYLDGDLTPQDCVYIQEHIQDCQPCVAFVESLRTSIQAMREFRSGEPVRTMPDDVREKLKTAWKAALQRRTG